MLELIVFVSGALVMVLEMVGARVMAPHLGTSTVVWTSLIGVVLACMAAGGYAGGRLADSHLSRKVLARILAGAGVGCLLTGLAHPLVGEAVSTGIENLYGAAVLAALCIFALPATLFGMVSPYVIRLRLANLAHSGATVGRLYALSTAGSIVGTFLGGFVLVSYFPSTHILLGTGAGMLLLALLARPHKVAGRATLLLLALAGIWAADDLNMAFAARSGSLTMETPYSTLRISSGYNEAGRLVRYLSTGPGFVQSGAYVDNPAELLLEYCKFYGLGTTLFPQSEKVLMLGGGAYSVPKWLLGGQSGLRGERLNVHVVELDPGMTLAARAYFQLSGDPRLSITHDDARRFLNRNTEKFDLVFVDLFNTHYSIPFHVGTQEAVTALRRAVSEDGAVMLNIISAVDGPRASILRALNHALQASFAEVRYFSVRGLPGEETQNLMALAFPRPRPDLAQSLDPANPDPRLQSFVSRLLPPLGPDDVPALTDELAPVERYARAQLQ